MMYNKRGYMTPWGEAQYKDNFAKGVNFYGTAGHGGMKVQKAINKKIPVEFRNKSGWYEEDCEIYKVYYFILDDKTALEGLKRWFPDACNHYFEGMEPTSQITATIKDNSIFNRMKKGSVVEFDSKIKFSDGSELKKLKWLGGSKFTLEKFDFPLFNLSNWKNNHILAEYLY